MILVQRIQIIYIFANEKQGRLLEQRERGTPHPPPKIRGIL